jgi:hypothetical protein
MVRGKHLWLKVLTGVSPLEGPDGLGLLKQEADGGKAAAGLLEL